MKTHRVTIEEFHDGRPDDLIWRSQPLVGRSSVLTLQGPHAATEEANSTLLEMERLLAELEPLIGWEKVHTLVMAANAVDVARWAAVTSSVIATLTTEFDGPTSVILVDRDPDDIPATGRSRRRRLTPHVQVAVWRITAGYLLTALVMLLVGVLAGRWRSRGGR